jgi:hypothetical protein
MAFRAPFVAVLASLSLTLVACGGDDGQPTPEGPHYHYVANQVLVPTTNTQSRDYGLDLNGDGQTDNQLGMVLSTLAQMGFKLQDTVDTAVAEGSIILLVDFQTKSFTSTTAAGIQVFLGDMEMPAACNAGETYNVTTKTGCGHHLTGTGSFSIAANSPQNAALAGKVVNGKFTGGPGDLTLQIALGGTDAIELNLIGARAKAENISETMIGTATSGGAILAGAITKDDIDNKVIPAIQLQLVPIIQRDCPNAVPTTCVCTDPSTGKTILGLFDADHDCKVSVEEIKTNNLIVSLLSPDVTIDGKMALSLGIKIVGVGAMFTVPGQM